MKTQDPTRKRQLAQIHIARKDLGLDEDTYRAMLMDVAGVESAADLTAKGRRDVLARFESRGWKNKKHRAPEVTAEKAPYIRKIGALLADMKLSWNYAHGIAKQMFKKQRVQWCEADQLRAVVAALAKEQTKRREKATCTNSQTETNV
ncbi:MAG: regulatory protein GemA [Nitrosomonas sp.]|nr:regulatory protein GemA [Nitrosomonas sp.]